MSDTSHEMVQNLSMEDVRKSNHPGGLIAHWERAMVGQLARQVHERGEKFKEWPVARTIYLFDDFHYGEKEILDPNLAHRVRLSVRVVAVPR